MSDWKDDYNLLGLGGLTSLVTNIKVHTEEEVGELEAEFFGICLGESSHRKPAVLTADIFEVSILYGSFSIHIKSVSIGIINLSLLFLCVLCAFAVKSFRCNRKRYHKEENLNPQMADLETKVLVSQPQAVL
jgi:Ca2+/Na+ antiporter